MRPLVLVLALSALALPVGAAAPQERDVARLQAEYRDESARARRLRAEADQAAQEIADLDRQLASLRSAVGQDDAVIAGQRARLRELGQREARLVAEMSRNQGKQSRLLSALQMMSRKPPPPLLVPSDKAVDTVRASILLRAITPELQARATSLSDRQAEIVRIRRLAALNSEQLFTTESARGDRRAEMENLSARKAALQSVLVAEARAAERAARTLEARLRSLGANVPAADADVETTAARLPAGRNRLTPPVSGAPSARFGGRSSGWRWRADGVEAVAPAAGRVVHVGPLSGWGEVVILDLGPGWRAVVAGLDNVAVEEGARVADGQALGRSAQDGEVYFELRREERPVDPSSWLR